MNLTARRFYRVKRCQPSPTVTHISLHSGNLNIIVNVTVSLTMLSRMRSKKIGFRGYTLYCPIQTGDAGVGREEKNLERRIEQSSSRKELKRSLLLKY